MCETVTYITRHV